MRRLLIPFLLLVLCFSSWAGLQDALRVKRKAKRLQERIVSVHQQGGDVASLMRAAKRVKALGEAGRLGKAEAVLDKALSGQFAAEKPEGRYFENPRPVRIKGYHQDAMEPFLSRDGKYLFFNNLNQPHVNTNIFYAERVSDTEFRFKGEVRGVNTKFLDGVPSMDRDGNFYFVSVRSRRRDLRSVYTGRFEDGRVRGVRQVRGLSLNRKQWINMDLEVSADGNTIYFTQTHFGRDKKGPDRSYFQIARRDKDGSFRVDPASPLLMSEVNRLPIIYAPATSADEREFFFTGASVEEGRIAGARIYRSVREKRGERFSAPERLSIFRGFYEAPTISPDGRRLYYHKKVAGRFRIYTVERKPSVKKP